MDGRQSGGSRSAYFLEVAAALAIGLGVVRLVWGLFDGSALGIAAGAAFLALGLAVMFWRRGGPRTHASDAEDPARTRP